MSSFSLEVLFFFAVIKKKKKKATHLFSLLSTWDKQKQVLLLLLSGFR